jgi:hypothetical protein
VLNVFRAVLETLLAHHAHGKVWIRVHGLDHAHRPNLFVLAAQLRLLGLCFSRGPSASQHVGIAASGAGCLEAGQEFFFSVGVDLLLSVQETVVADGFVLDLAGGVFGLGQVAGNVGAFALVEKGSVVLLLGLLQLLQPRGNLGLLPVLSLLVDLRVNVEQELAHVLLLLFFYFRLLGQDLLLPKPVKLLVEHIEREVRSLVAF